MRRTVVVTAVAVALFGGACGLGNKQAQADRIERAGDQLMKAPSVQAILAANVSVILPKTKVVNPGPPRIAPENVHNIGVTINPAANTAAVGTNTKLNTNAIVFADGKIFERIVQKAIAAAHDPTTAAAPSNFNALAASYSTQLVAVATPSASAPAPVVADFPGVSIPTTTTSTTAPSILHRKVQIVREWAAFDYAAIADHDNTKHAGSLAINPVDLLRLARGVLAGSVKQTAVGGGVVSYSANVGRDRAERALSDKQRKVIDKEFAANAISRSVFPAHFVIDAQGHLLRMTVTLRQALSSTERADLTIALQFLPVPNAVKISGPGKRGTVNVHTLGELVHTVSGQ